MGYSIHSTANAGDGRLGRKLGMQLEYSPRPEQLGSLITFRMVDDEWNWILRPEAATALERLGCVDPLPAAPTAEPQHVHAPIAAAQALASRQEAEARCEPFDPTDEQDARNRVKANLVRRQGQGAFRGELLASYGGLRTMPYGEWDERGIHLPENPRETSHERCHVS